MAGVWEEFVGLEDHLRLRLTTRGEGDGKRARMGSKPPLDFGVLALLVDFEHTYDWIRESMPGRLVSEAPVNWYFETVPGFDFCADDLAYQARLILNQPAPDGNAIPAYKNITNLKPLLVDRRRAAKTVGVPAAVIDAWTQAGRIRNHAPGNRAPQYDLAQLVNLVGNLAGETLRCGDCGRPKAMRGKTAAGSQRYAHQCPKKKRSKK